jgi:thiosulfate/3-mercaptopyruvate sulfurtransferase
MLALTLFSAQATATAPALPGPLVQGDWLKANKDSPALVVLDIQEPPAFTRHHVPGSINWPFSQWRTGDKDDPPKSLLPLAALTERLGELGISAETPLVIVATGTSSGDLSASARVFWTLKVLGHDQVAILDGGLASYVNDHRGAFANGTQQARRAPVTYDARPNLDLLADAVWLQDSDMPRLDARTLGEFVGVVAGPGERPGTLPGAHHLPFDWLTQDSSGRLRDRDALDRLFEHAGINGEAAVHFCHTGNRAALTWFVDYAVMGNREARLYDASMIEWGKDPALPIETRLGM